MHSGRELSAEEIQEDRLGIEREFRTMRMTEHLKEVKLSCGDRCGYRLREEDLRVHSTDGLDSLTKMDCFNRCMNIRLEQGPFVRDLGNIAEDRVPVLFVWPTGMHVASVRWHTSHSLHRL